MKDLNLLWKMFCDRFCLVKATEPRIQLLCGLLGGSMTLFPAFWDEMLEEMGCYTWAFHNNTLIRMLAYFWAVVRNLIACLLTFAIVIIVGLVAVVVGYKGKDV